MTYNPYNKKLVDNDTVYTAGAFVDMVIEGYFVDYDGFGYPVKDGFVNAKIVIRPSRLERIPADATHIVWFNR